MPDLKIVELKPSKETDNNNVEVIRLLEDALQVRQRRQKPEPGAADDQ